MLHDPTGERLLSPSQLVSAYGSEPESGLGFCSASLRRAGDTGTVTPCLESSRRRPGGAGPGPGLGASARPYWHYSAHQLEFRRVARLGVPGRQAEPGPGRKLKARIPSSILQPVSHAAGSDSDPGRQLASEVLDLASPTVTVDRPA